jgi:hypothetical protein
LQVVEQQFSLPQRAVPGAAGVECQLVVRAWCQGTAGPLRKLAEKSPDEIWAIQLEMESLEQVAEQVLRLARSGIPGVHRREDRTDGQD